MKRACDAETDRGLRSRQPGGKVGGGAREPEGARDAGRGGRESHQTSAARGHRDSRGGSLHTTELTSHCRGSAQLPTSNLPLPTLRWHADLSEQPPCLTSPALAWLLLKELLCCCSWRLQGAASTRLTTAVRCCMDMATRVSKEHHAISASRQYLKKVEDGTKERAEH